MIKILFVCHGNICRSPMAEYIMKKLVEERGLEDEFIIDSKATSSEELGNFIYPNAKRKLIEKGISVGNHVATKLVKEDYDKYDLIICMDNNNMRNMYRIFNDDKDNKLHLLMEYTGKNKEVSDPWYSGDFETAYNDIYIGCLALLVSLL